MSEAGILAFSTSFDNRNRAGIHPFVLHPCIMSCQVMLSTIYPLEPKATRRLHDRSASSSSGLPSSKQGRRGGFIFCLVYFVLTADALTQLMVSGHDQLLPR